MKNASRWAFAFGICAILSNFLMFVIGGAPASIGFGIMGIGMALTTLENKKLPKQSTAAVVLCSIGIVFGLILYAMLYMAYATIKDPAAAHQLLRYIEENMQMFPPQVQEIFQNFL